MAALGGAGGGRGWGRGGRAVETRGGIREGALRASQ